mmetsp:Transcript_18145/g.51251  ORF Transcript_18145/g.51251 Transcript_18145/m.51251 type:complete len:83 (+) Transcript_18145:38-286(+)
MAAEKKDSEGPKKAAATVGGEAPKVEALEEDDEFDEFETEGWTPADEDKTDADAEWRDDWEDDEVDDAFCTQLRAELAKTKA